MSIKILDTVVLQKDMSDHGLKQGNIGAVVEVCEPDGLIVEFITASGQTQALVTLIKDDVRPVGPSDMLTVRNVNAA